VKPSRDTPAGRVYNDLRNLARHHDRDPVEYFTLYTLAFADPVLGGQASGSWSPRIQNWTEVPVGPVLAEPMGG